MDAKWRQYELMILEHHHDTYKHMVWHTDVIPEEHLMNAGFIHDFNRHRLSRIAKTREAKGKSIKYSDYGMDFLSKDNDGLYHAGQVKYYTRRHVTAKDLGTFMSVVYNRIRNPGYIYTVGNLEVNLREDINNSNGMLVHHCVPFKEAKSYIVSDETSYELRPYQQDAIHAILAKQCDSDDNASCEDDDLVADSVELNTCNRKALELFCGGGKTVIAGHVLRQSSYNLIICIAPLRASVHQLKMRLMPFLPSYDVILVDSDEGGITDIETIKVILQNQTKPIVIFSTFKSTEDVLTEVVTDCTENMFLLVDEVHNMLTNDKLCKFADKFHNSLLLSATIPEEMFETLSVSKCYTYGISEAIKNRYCCDYEVFLPYVNLETNEIDVDIPFEIAQYDKSLSAKAMFLATGMLRTGSRRCIVYLASQQECDAFLEVAKTAFEEYHGVQFWGGKVDSTVSSKKRDEILKEFQSSHDAHIIRIIASVRILDEAIDVPKCDSEFITVVGEQTSDIRTIQRLCRGCRIDKDNPSKKNNLFMWCSDWSKAINCLSLLKDADIEFHTKIRIINSNYDVGANEKVMKDGDTQRSDLSKYVTMKCLSLDERWELRRQQWIEQYNKLGHKPNIRSHDEDEKRAGKWHDHLKQAKKGKGHYKLIEEHIDVLNSTTGWTWGEADNFTENYNNWVLQYGKLGHKPKSNSQDEGEKRAGVWQCCIRKAKRGKGGNNLTDEQIAVLDSTTGWTWEEDSFTQQYNNWVTQYSKLGRKPKESSQDEDEKKAGRWQCSIRQAKKGIKGGYKLTDDQVIVLDSTTGWTWEEADSFTEQYNNWVTQYMRLGHKPKENSQDEGERKAGVWQCRVRSSKRGKGSYNITAEQITLLDSTKGWKWEVKYSFTEQYNNWVTQYIKLGHTPKNNSQDEGEKKAALWQSNMRQSKKGNGHHRKLTDEQIIVLDKTQGWSW